ncbi:MAG: hypothetical protein V1720_10745 [bacterium]
MNSKKKRFDSVQMVRDIRNAYFEKENNPKFSVGELKRIKEKWTGLLDQQESENKSPGKSKIKTAKIIAKA